MSPSRCRWLAILALALLTPAVGAQQATTPTPLADGAAVARYLDQVEPQLAPEDRRARQAALPGLVLPPGVTLAAFAYPSDGLAIRAFVLRPRGATGRLPAILFNRGGTGDYGSLTDPTSSIGLAELARIASWGYVVVASQYRGGGGSEGQDHYGGDDVHDVLALADWLRAQPDVDPARIGLFGWSRGSLMSLQALRHGLRVRAVALGGVVGDLAALVAHRPVFDALFAELDPQGYAADKAGWLAARSAVHWIDALPADVPMLMLVGQSDWRAPSSQALALAQALDAAGHPLRLVLYAGGDHALSGEREAVFAELHTWFDRYVRDLAPPPTVDRTPQED